MLFYELTVTRTNTTQYCVTSTIMCRQSCDLHTYTCVIAELLLTSDVCVCVVTFIAFSQVFDSTEKCLDMIKISNFSSALLFTGRWDCMWYLCNQQSRGVSLHC